MKRLLAIGLAGLLAGCAAQQHVTRTGVIRNGQIIWDKPGVTLFGEPVQPSTVPVQSRGQRIAEGIAQGISDFSTGYAQGASQYHATQPIYDPPPQWHSGAIYGPDGQTSLYNLGPHGGTIYGPNGQTTIISGN
jgi:hypothetical protein